MDIRGCTDDSTQIRNFTDIQADIEVDIQADIRTDSSAREGYLCVLIKIIQEGVLKRVYFKRR